MKKIKIIVLILVYSLISIACTSLDDEAIESLEGTTELLEDESLEGTAESTQSMDDEQIEIEQSEWEIELSEWDTAKYNFFYEYMDEPEAFTSYGDYYDIICYMLLNHVEYYEVTIEEIEYEEEEIHEILESMVAAYDNATLFLNTYTDFWSHFSGTCSKKTDGDGEVLSYTFSFEFTQKDGLDEQVVQEEVLLAEEACFQLVEALFEAGTLSAEMSEQERAYVLYKWICTNVSYAYDAPDTESSEVKPDNCYSALIEKCAVCQGITGAYVQLCRLAGVPMYVQLGYTDDEAHSWCKILDEETGKWMYIDPTWGITGAEETYTDQWFWVTQEYMELYEGAPREFITYIE